MTPKEYFRARRAQGSSQHFPKMKIRLDPALDQMIRERKDASLDTWIPAIIINHNPEFKKEWLRRNEDAKSNKGNNQESRAVDSDASAA